MRIIAFVVSGLEEVAENELLQINSVKILNVQSKRIVFEFNDNLQLLSDIKTVDDLGILVYQGKFANLAEDEIFKVIESIHLEKYSAQINSFRKVVDEFSITVSVYKNSNISQSSLKSLLSNLISNHYGWSYNATDHTNFDIRINIDENELIATTRIFKKPLHQRNYKQSFKKGSLKPTIAASLIKSLESEHKGDLVDLFCGSGTILCEAHLQGYNVYGSDIDLESCKNTIQNLMNLDFKNKSQIQLYSATSTKWGTASFDYVVSNLPWNKQVKVQGMHEVIDKFVFELKRIMRTEFRGVFLVNKSEYLTEKLKTTFPNKQVDILKLSFNGQSPEIVRIY